MKYLNLLTNPHTLALTVIMLLGIVCLMATDEFTANVIIVKIIGGVLLYVYSLLYKRWNRQGKVEPINDLFRGETHGDPEEMHHKED